MATSSGSGQAAARTNSRTLGTLWILYGILRLAIGLLMVIYSAVATVMFGALLVNVANPFFWMDLFHAFYVIAIIVTVLAGIFGVLAGLALMAQRASARGLSLVAAFLSVSDLPLGTTLGTYTMVLFLSR